MKILPYSLASQSAKVLAEALDVKRLRRENSRFSNRHNDLIINWGCTSYDESFPIYNMINPFDAVQRAVNKLHAFNCLNRCDDVEIPEFTVNPVIVREKLTGSDKVEWLARTHLRGSSGSGIVPIKGNAESIPHAPLYVRYFSKTEEYRVHVMENEVFYVQKKRRRSGIERTEEVSTVRNHDNGWVYCTQRVDLVENPTTPKAIWVYSQAVAAVKALGLNFGAVDIIWSSRSDKGCVLEVNTACGLEGTTVEKYANAIMENYCG